MKLWLITTASFVGIFALHVEAQKKVICYHQSKSVYREGHGRFDIEDIDPFLCTHLIFGFAGLDPITFKIKPLDASHDPEANGSKVAGAYRRFNDLRRQNNALETLIAIGGRDEDATAYSAMTASSKHRRTFIDSVVALLNRHPFNGLDFHWVIPGNGGGNVQADKDNFVLLLKELREEFDKHGRRLDKYGWLLTASLAARKAVIGNTYDIPGISRFVDFINVMAYDFHGCWENHTGHHAPLNARPSESKLHHLLTVNYTIHYWLNEGVPRCKIILGMALFGRSFKLANEKEYDSGAAAVGPNFGGPYTREPGTLGYNELCERPNWKKIRDTSYQAPFAHSYKDWVSYDDADSLKVKCDFANSLGLGGGMVWSLDTDDFRGSCNGVKFLLTKTIKQALNSGTTTVPPIIISETPEPNVMSSSSSTASPLPLQTTSATHKLNTTSRFPSTLSSFPAPTAKCPSPGYHRDPKNCSKFYSCGISHGQWFISGIQQCAHGGLRFDNVKKECLWAKDVDCSS